MIKIKQLILNILFPINCLGCKKQDIYLCDECFKKIPEEEFFYCPVCEQRSSRGETHESCQGSSYLDGLFVAGMWQSELLQDIIHKFKYKFIQDLKFPLSEILLSKLRNSSCFFEPNLIDGYFNFLIPVPLFKRRLLWRGFNQAELLAGEISGKINTPILNNAIWRIKNTLPQVGKKQKKRQRDMQGAFKIDPDYVTQLKAKKILLVDDVVTTGSTMQEVARVLKSSGTGEVWGLALARG